MDDTDLPGTVADPLDQLRGSLSSLERSQGEAVGRIRTRRAAAERLALEPSQRLPPPPAPPELPPPPQGQETSPFQALGSFAAAFGALASLATRTPLTSALNASAAAIGAIRQNDIETYKHKIVEWKAHADYADRLFDYEHEQYQDILNNKRLDDADKAARLNALFAANRDEAGLITLQQNGVKAAEQLIKDRDELRLKFVDANTKLQELAEKTRHDTEIEKNQRDRNAAVSGKTLAKEAENIDLAIGQVDTLIAMAAQNKDTVTGIGGLVNRGVETVEGITGLSDRTPASNFQSQLDVLRLELPKLLTGSSKSAHDERTKVDTIARGINPGDTRAKTVNSLVQLRQILQDRRNALKVGAEEMSAQVSDLTTMSDDELRQELGLQ